MPIPVDSTHVAHLTVPVSADPADAIMISEDLISHTVTFSASGDTPAAARQKIKDFISATKDASLAP